MMKKKRTYVTLALIIAILMLGVGYAAVTKTLTINGTLNATVDDSQFVVEFTKADGLTKISGAPEINGLNASFVVDGSQMKTKGDTASVTFTITNNTTTAVGLSADLSDATVTNNNAEFTVTASNPSDKILAPGESATTTVTVVLNETPTEAISNKTVTINYTATAIQP